MGAVCGSFTLCRASALLLKPIENLSVKSVFLHLQTLKIYYHIMETQIENSKNIWETIIRLIVTILSAISGAFFGASIG